ncbi:hypothetical protein LPJ38_36310 [Bradyrhizobium daqingense]|uniref:Uncharacterized protein n=1 Tax=Bradyrhizobium ottawaense TaxID=931866 RepID=A0A2U8P186_9BRAD|nr:MULTISPECIES: hypothetical protein [Bradyrhizobium]AWL91433.1 hypothetical protein CIT37_03475 [Bradyrhizobium ottawaense]UFS88985.1 hypothetical protein LPJ38_36310 [Bradyrhizobium daqingense]
MDQDHVGTSLSHALAAGLRLQLRQASDERFGSRDHKKIWIPRAASIQPWNSFAQQLLAASAARLVTLGNVLSSMTRALALAL